MLQDLWEVTHAQATSAEEFMGCEILYQLEFPRETESIGDGYYIYIYIYTESFRGEEPVVQIPV